MVFKERPVVMEHAWLKRKPLKFLKRILQSRFFRKAIVVAVVVARKRDEAIGFVNKAGFKINKKENLSIFAIIRDKISLTFRMLKSYFHGEYINVSRDTLLRILAGIIYFVFVVDFIPDFLPI